MADVLCLLCDDQAVFAAHRLFRAFSTALVSHECVFRAKLEFLKHATQVYEKRSRDSRALHYTRHYGNAALIGAQLRASKCHDPHDKDVHHKNAS